jgi:hypothetical protein
VLPARRVGTSLPFDKNPRNNMYKLIYVPEKLKDYLFTASCFNLLPPSKRTRDDQTKCDTISFEQAQRQLKMDFHA